MLLKIIFFVLSVQLFPLPTASQNITKIEELKNLSLSEDYAALRRDAQWFFQHVEILADFLYSLLPAKGRSLEHTQRALVNGTNSSTFIENTRLYLLLGLRHLLIGIKQISLAFQQKFNSEHMQELHHFTLLSHIIRDLMSRIQRWLASVRVSLNEIFGLYNRYIPEVLLGKCLGRYVVASYPNRAFYEYPFLLLAEMFEHFWQYSQTTKDTIINLEHMPVTEAEDISEEQNEIWPEGKEAQIIMPRQLSMHEAGDKDEINKKNMNVTHGRWQKCLKLYMADSISRQLKLYFLENED